MKKLYFVFDQIPSAQSGGLIGMYLNICEILKYDYDIEIVSIYNCDKDNLKLFENYNIKIMNKFNIDNRFFKVIQYIRDKVNLDVIIAGIWQSVEDVIGPKETKKLFHMNQNFNVDYSDYLRLIVI